jgi:hypothetical protein
MNGGKTKQPESQRQMWPIGDETGENGQPRVPAGFDFRAGRI